ncbi:hypothetical protein ACLOJK_027670 [Asimina triloba]
MHSGLELNFCVYEYIICKELLAGKLDNIKDPLKEIRKEGGRDRRRIKDLRERSRRRELGKPIWCGASQSPSVADQKTWTMLMNSMFYALGVSLVEDGSEGITLEMEMQWDGNPSIVLDIGTRVGVAVPIQVKNIGFTGVFRLIFRPMVDAFPCFGAVSYSLREKKKLDFSLKVVGGDITAIPGISSAIEDLYPRVAIWGTDSVLFNTPMLDVIIVIIVVIVIAVAIILINIIRSFSTYETIRDAIEDSLTWPVRKIVPILPGDYSYLELKPIGTLQVKLVQAKDLTNKDLIGKSDPFSVLYIRPIRDRMKTSKTINNQLNPIWNEHFEFVVEDASTQHLVVKVYDDEGVQASELIGCVQFPLKDLEPGKVKDSWLKLVKDLEIQRDNKYRGQIYRKVHLELLYVPYGMENGISDPFNPKFSMTSLEKALKTGSDSAEVAHIERKSVPRKRDVIVRGVLSVTVLSAEDLPGTDLMGKADPFVVIRMKKTETKNKTRVVNDSLNPAWNQTFDFVVEDGTHDMLILEVYDHDTFGKPPYSYIREKIVHLWVVSFIYGEPIGQILTLFIHQTPCRQPAQQDICRRLEWKISVKQPSFNWDYMGRCILTLTRVILEGEYSDSIPLDGAKSGKLNLHLKWTAQPIYRDPN